MGRPLNKRNFGAVDTTASAPNESPIKGIIVSAMKTDTARSSTIVKQRGSKRFVVTNGTDGNFTATLAQGTSFAADTAATMVLYGYVAGSGATENESTSAGTKVAIAKITGRRCTGYNGTVYKWSLQNDSTADYIELTAI